VEEQGRVINYEPGVYKGKPDTSLTEVQQRTLRQRSLFPESGAADQATPSPAGTARPLAIRKPEVRIDPSIARAKLNARIQHQRGNGI